MRRTGPKVIMEFQKKKYKWNREEERKKGRKEGRRKEGSKEGEGGREGGREEGREEGRERNCRAFPQTKQNDNSPIKVF
jgi:hypothetical protein